MSASRLGESLIEERVALLQLDAPENAFAPPTGHLSTAERLVTRPFVALHMAVTDLGFAIVGRPYQNKILFVISREEPVGSFPELYLPLATQCGEHDMSTLMLNKLLSVRPTPLYIHAFPAIRKRGDFGSVPEPVQPTMIDPVCSQWDTFSGQYPTEFRPVQDDFVFAFSPSREEVLDGPSSIWNELVLCQQLGRDYSWRGVTAVMTKRLLSRSRCRMGKNSLPYEGQIYRLLRGSTAVPRVHWSGVDGGANVLIIDQLGLTLQYLRQACRGKLSLKTVLMVGYQMLEFVEHAYSRGIIVRDIKLDIFTVGLRPEHSSTIYALDFGLACPRHDSLVPPLRPSPVAGHLGCQHRDKLDRIRDMNFDGQFDWSKPSAAPRGTLVPDKYHFEVERDMIPDSLGRNLWVV
ncbi:kinase-like domain-containing protein [Sparassis latifolia]